MKFVDLIIQILLKRLCSSYLDLYENRFTLSPGYFSNIILKGTRASISDMLTPSAVKNHIRTDRDEI